MSVFCMCMLSIEQEKVLKYVSDSRSRFLMILPIYLCLKHNTQFSDGAMFKQQYVLPCICRTNENGFDWPSLGCSTKHCSSGQLFLSVSH